MPIVETVVRPIAISEYALLETFLYEAIHVPVGAEPPERDVVFVPEIHVYIKEFGTAASDICFVAELDGAIIESKSHNTIVGAAWSRILAGPGIKGYGNIDRHTPELAISVLPDYRGKGVGRKLLNTLHSELTKRGYEKISLSVQKTNPSIHLYKRAGYKTIEEQETDYLMVCELKNPIADKNMSGSSTDETVSRNG